jgi:hypothetical protein
MPGGVLCVVFVLFMVTSDGFVDYLLQTREEEIRKSASLSRFLSFGTSPPLWKTFIKL